MGVTVLPVRNLPHVESVSGSDSVIVVQKGVAKQGAVSLIGAGGLPDGAATGDLIRWNAETESWEVKSEPLEFKGLVLTPELASSVDVEGAIFYSSAQKAVMVCTDI